MRRMSVTSIHDQLDAVMTEVCRTNEPLMVRRGKKRPVMIVSKSEYTSMMETFHLLSSASNGLRVLKAADDMRSGRNIVDGNLFD